MFQCARFGLPKAGELAKARRPVDDLDLRQRPVERLILERRRLELFHGLAAGQILAPRLLRIRMRGDDRLEPLLHARAIDLETLRAHDLADQQPERHAPARTAARAARAPAAVAGSCVPARRIVCACSSRICCLEHAVRHLERIVAVQRLEQLLAQRARGRPRASSRSMLCRTSLRSSVTPPVCTPKASRETSSIHGGRLRSSTLRDLEIELGRLAGHRGGAVIVRKLCGDRLASPRPSCRPAPARSRAARGAHR